jgi:hypothetical protein
VSINSFVIATDILKLFKLSSLSLRIIKSKYQDDPLSIHSHIYTASCVALFNSFRGGIKNFLIKDAAEETPLVLFITSFLGRNFENGNLVPPLRQIIYKSLFFQRLKNWIHLIVYRQDKTRWKLLQIFAWTIFPESLQNKSSGLSITLPSSSLFKYLFYKNKALFFN